MIHCPAKEKIVKKWWIFTWNEDVPCEWEFTSLDGSSHTFWTITYVCKHCGAKHESWPLNDKEMMTRLGLKKMPTIKYFYWKSDLESDLAEQKMEHK